ncbi:hypothetical protein [Flavobacterium sp.]|uniref:hypothetical protein n=1 Tax=Flavobacterium sp. TaxID=239 RepID=UPI0026288F85|nr:hypothetical protein [Flavobacterium sp.]
MKKYGTIVCSLFFTGLIYAQVGINTESPMATLDITGKKGVTDIDGVLAPRLTRAELTAKGNGLYGADQNGLIIFITDVTGGDILSQRTNIDESGYYYFDGLSNVWKKVNATPWKAIGTTIQADLNTQDVYQNGNVAIGDYRATVPTEKLDVNGNVRLRNMADGKLRTNYPYTIVAKADGTWASSRGNYGVWRGVSTNAQAVMSDDDEILNIFSFNASTITLPSNPKLGRVVTIRIDGAVSPGPGYSDYIYTVATPTVIPVGYLPTNYTAVGAITAVDYKTTIKVKTAVKLVWTGPLGGGGLGWVQIGGDNQMIP